VFGEYAAMEDGEDAEDAEEAEGAEDAAVQLSANGNVMASMATLTPEGGGALVRRPACSTLALDTPEADGARAPVRRTACWTLGSASTLASDPPLASSPVVYDPSSATSRRDAVQPPAPKRSKGKITMEEHEELLREAVAKESKESSTSLSSEWRVNSCRLRFVLNGYTLYGPRPVPRPHRPGAASRHRRGRAFLLLRITGQPPPAATPGPHPGPLFCLLTLKRC